MALYKSCVARLLATQAHRVVLAARAAALNARRPCGPERREHDLVPMQAAMPDAYGYAHPGQQQPQQWGGPPPLAPQAGWGAPPPAASGMPLQGMPPQGIPPQFMPPPAQVQSRAIADRGVRDLTSGRLCHWRRRLFCSWLLRSSPVLGRQTAEIVCPRDVDSISSID